MKIMRRYDFSLVEFVFCACVAGGLLIAFLTPSRVRGIVELKPWAASYSEWILIGLSLFAAFWVYRLARTWGPIRASRAERWWLLSGPADRTPVLRRRLTHTAVASALSCCAISLVLSLLYPRTLVLMLIVGFVGGILATVAAYLTQLAADNRGKLFPLALRPNSPDYLHQRSFSPRDSFAGAIGLATSMMDFSWIIDSRIVRWQSRSISSVSRRSMSRSPFIYLVSLDWLRFRRHPDGARRWCLSVGLSLLGAELLDFHHGATVVIAFFAYCAGNSVSSGLRQISTNAALRRVLGRPDYVSVMPHCVIPVAAVVVYAALVAPVWHLSVVAVLTLVIGIGIAVIRRGTRDGLPYASVMIIEPLLVGAAVQPLLILAQLRGVLAMLMTAAIMVLL